MKRLFAFILCASVMIPGGDRIAFGQAGSTGGTIGKTGKSVSGGEEERPGDRKSGDRKAAATPATISGKWSWRAKCEDGTFSTGEYDFDQDADGTLSGSCRIISRPALGSSCSALSGRVAGNKVTLTVRWHDLVGSHQNPYEFTIAAGGQSMQGTEHAQTSGECTYQVKRLSRR
jgi:outer membrane receptor protein involved in Fe transport